jgi:hypothetical protein
MTPAVLRLRAEDGPEFMERFGHALKTDLHPPPVPRSAFAMPTFFHPNPNFDSDALEN